MRRLMIGLLAIVGFLAGGGLVAVSQAADLGDRLDSGGTISVGDQLTSANQGFRFVLQGDGNAVVYFASNEPQFSTNTTGGTRFVLQNDGNAVLYSAANQPLWNSGTAGRPAAYMIMQNDGNLVIVGTDGRPTWSKNTGVIGAPPPPATGPTVVGQTLGSGERLSGGQALAIGGWLALMQDDGNFVIYANGAPQFNTRTGGNRGAFLLMQTDGNLVVYSAASRPLYNTGTGGNASARLVLQNDGNLVVYRTNNTAAWSRTTGLIGAPPAPPGDVYYNNCAEVRAAGKAPLYRGQPGYRSGLDSDGDGVACET